jgi:hypothetical protein
VAKLANPPCLVEEVASTDSQRFVEEAGSAGSQRFVEGAGSAGSAVAVELLLVEQNWFLRFLQNMREGILDQTPFPCLGRTRRSSSA